MVKRYVNRKMQRFGDERNRHSYADSKGGITSEIYRTRNGSYRIWESENHDCRRFRY